jgi:hypothetical protein
MVVDFRLIIIFKNSEWKRKGYSVRAKNLHLERQTKNKYKSSGARETVKRYITFPLMFFN